MKKLVGRASSPAAIGGTGFQPVRGTGKMPVPQERGAAGGGGSTSGLDYADLRLMIICKGDLPGESKVPAPGRTGFGQP